MKHWEEMQYEFKVVVPDNKRREIDSTVEKIRNEWSPGVYYAHYVLLAICIDARLFRAVTKSNPRLCYLSARPRVRKRRGL